MYLMQPRNVTHQSQVSSAGVASIEFRNSRRNPRVRHTLSGRKSQTEPTMTKPPPVPPDNQSHKGTGDPKTGNAHQIQKGRVHIDNPREQGQAGNTAQNTTHQGYQQDR